jgi:uncharacterized membrane protein YtjA (UPF0391 family)
VCSLHPEPRAHAGTARWLAAAARGGHGSRAQIISSIGARSHAVYLGRLNMLHYAVVFLVIALIAALFGFGGIAAGAAGIAKILFVVFLIGAIVSFLMHGRSRV